MDAVTYNLIKNICRYPIIIVDLIREWAERNERQYSQGPTTREHSPDIREQNVRVAEETLRQRLQEQIHTVTQILDNRNAPGPSAATAASSAASSDDETAVPAGTDEGFYRATDTDEEY